MIRFILRRRTRSVFGAELTTYITIDGDVDELEAALKFGGLGEDQFDYTELVGAELLPEEEP